MCIYYSGRKNKVQLLHIAHNSPTPKSITQSSMTPGHQIKEVDTSEINVTYRNVCLKTSMIKTMGELQWAYVSCTSTTFYFSLKYVP